MDDRKSVWSVTDRGIFSFLFVLFFISGVFLRFAGSYEIQWNFSIVGDVGAIGLFAVTASFFLLEVKDVMLGVHEAVKQWNLKRGLERGRRERDELIRKWLSEERAKGSEGFREDPPFLNNGSED
ncbi:MAG: hypothetical protein OXR72_12670 [Gemmatimonadota bacterium]|nr:hypothetical protein [Gemmatimonadota bacterium]